MYEWITHTWNVIKGKCYHDCSYCYMKKWGQLKDVRLDESEFKIDLGKGNFIFIGSSCDMFAEKIPTAWIERILSYCNKFDNKYLLPSEFFELIQKIKSCSEMVNYPNNWDSYNAKKIKKETYINAIEFLMDFTRYIFGIRNDVLIPDILPVPDGSIDIEWEHEYGLLLVNIPNDINEDFTFYSESQRNTPSIIEGVFSPNNKFDLPDFYNYLNKYL